MITPTERFVKEELYGNITSQFRLLYYYSLYLYCSTLLLVEATETDLRFHLQNGGYTFLVGGHETGKTSLLCDLEKQIVARDDRSSVFYLYTDHIQPDEPFISALERLTKNSLTWPEYVFTGKALASTCIGMTALKGCWHCLQAVNYKHAHVIEQGIMTSICPPI